jgi:hypothetical protein
MHKAIEVLSRDAVSEAAYPHSAPVLHLSVDLYHFGTTLLLWVVQLQAQCLSTVF